MQSILGDRLDLYCVLSNLPLPCYRQVAAEQTPGCLAEHMKIDFELIVVVTDAVLE
jgi:hypothetical protein